MGYGGTRLGSKKGRKGPIRKKRLVGTSKGSSHAVAAPVPPPEAQGAALSPGISPPEASLAHGGAELPVFSGPRPSDGRTELPAPDSGLSRKRKRQPPPAAGPSLPARGKVRAAAENDRTQTRQIVKAQRKRQQPEHSAANPPFTADQAAAVASAREILKARGMAVPIDEPPDSASDKPVSKRELRLANKARKLQRAELVRKNVVALPPGRPVGSNGPVLVSQRTMAKVMSMSRAAVADIANGKSFVPGRVDKRGGSNKLLTPAEETVVRAALVSESDAHKPVNSNVGRDIINQVRVGGYLYVNATSAILACAQTRELFGRGRVTAAKSTVNCYIDSAGMSYFRPTALDLKADRPTAVELAVFRRGLSTIPAGSLLTFDECHLR